MPRRIKRQRLDNETGRPEIVRPRDLGHVGGRPPNDGKGGRPLGPQHAPRVQVNLRLPAGDLERIRELAAEYGASLSDFIRAACLVERDDAVGEQLREAIAEQRLDREMRRRSRTKAVRTTLREIAADDDDDDDAPE